MFRTLARIILWTESSSENVAFIALGSVADSVFSDSDLGPKFLIHLQLRNFTRYLSKKKVIFRYNV